MHITLTPMRSDAALTLERHGEALTINGAVYDFGPVPEGATLPRAAVECDWLASDITRIAGALHLTLILPHGPIPSPTPPEAVAVTHPAPITDPLNGPVALPSYIPPEFSHDD